MAHYIFDARTQALGIPAMALSMSVLGFQGKPAATEAIEVCDAIGVDLRDHRSQPLNQALLRAASHIFIMEPFHEEALKKLAVDRTKIAYLGTLDPTDSSAEIVDPYQQTMDDFIVCRDRIVRAIDAFLAPYVAPR